MTCRPCQANLAPNGKPLGVCTLKGNSLKVFQTIFAAVGLAASLLMTEVRVGAAQAQSADDQSIAYAIQSRRAWANGDRSSAIIAALQGLPRNPDNADIQRFSAAWAGLRLAVVSRSMQIDVPDSFTAIYADINLTGTMVATVASAVRPYGDAAGIMNASNIGFNLWNPQTGANLVQLLPFSELVSTVHDAGPPAFSPDGRFVTLTSSYTGQTHVFDTATYLSVSVFGPRVPDDTGNPGHGLFSPDSTRFLRVGGSLGGATLYDVATWQPIAEIALPECRGPRALQGGTGSAIFVHIRNGCDGAQTHEIARVLSDGSLEVLANAAVATDLATDIFFMSVDPTGRHFLLWRFDDISSEAIILGTDGTVLGRLDAAQMGDGGVEFTLDGNALVYPHDDFFTVSVRGLNFDGTEYQPELADILPFRHDLHRLDGRNIRGGGSVAPFRGYTGKDLPNGPAFYTMVWDLLPPEVKAVVEEGRIRLD